MLSEGMRAYTLEQAAVQQSLANSFESLWKTPLADFKDNDNETNNITMDDTITQDLDGDDNNDRNTAFSDDKAKAKDLPEHL